MEVLSSSPSREEKINALISYCFLGWMMLLSREERFQSHFIKKHARAATLIHTIFIILIIAVIWSGNAGEMLIFHFSAINILFFVLFGVLFWFLWLGMMRAFLGILPRISWHLDTWDLTIWQETVTNKSRVWVILAHIPLLGPWINGQYGDIYSDGARTSTWVLMVWIVLLWIDPSMILMIILLIAFIVWIVYQSINLAISSRIYPLGRYLPTGKKIHIWIQSFVTYVQELFHHDSSMPDWGTIQEKVSENIHIEQTSLSPVIALPLINIGFLWRNRHTSSARRSWIQSLFITLLVIIGYFLNIWLLVTIGILWWWYGFIGIYWYHTFDIPVLTELSQFINTVIAKIQKFRAKKSETIIIDTSFRTDGWENNTTKNTDNTPWEQMIK